MMKFKFFDQLNVAHQNLMRVYFIAILFTVIFLDCSSSFAGEKTIVLQSVPAVQLKTEMQNYQNQIEMQDQKVKNLVAVLYQIQLKIKQVVKRKADMLMQKNEQSATLDYAQNQILTIQNQINEQRLRLSQRIQTASHMRETILAQIVLKSQNPQKINKLLHIIAASSKEDVNLIKDYQNNLTALTMQKKVAEQKISEIAKLEDKMRDQESLLLKEQELRRNFLEKIQKHKQKLIGQVMQLKDKALSDRINSEGLLDPLLQPSFLDQKGSLIWPLDGKVVSLFGPEDRENHKIKVYNKGVFIEASREGLRQAGIKSVFDGDVAFVGTLDGLNQSIIIDHGDHFYSVYSLVQNVLVKVKDRVKKNQKIASPGLGQYVGKNHPDVSGLYFEIRHFTEPYDPLLWMKGIQL